MRTPIARPTATAGRRAGIVAGLVLVATACAAPGSGTGGSAAPASAPPAHPEVTADIEVGTGPIMVAAGPDAVWVELHREDRVAQVDPGTNEQVSVTDIAMHCSLVSDGTTAWASYFRTGEVTHFDASSGEVLDHWDLSGDSCGLAVDGDNAWVALPTDGNLLELTPGEPEPTRTIHVAASLGPPAVTADAIWVTGEVDGGQLYKVDKASGEVTTVGPFAGADTVGAFFDGIWVVSRNTGSVWKLDPADGSVLIATEVHHPSGLVADDYSIWTAGYAGTLIELDPNTGEVRSETDMPHGYLGPPIIALGSLWTSALEDNRLLRVDLGR
jgi:outer membrane protein assembly factor BamB